MIILAVLLGVHAFGAILAEGALLLLVLVGCVVGIAFSVWHVIDRLRSGPRKSRWVLGWNGALHARESQSCSGKEGK
jgi:hypothetical protein